MTDSKVKFFKASSFNNTDTVDNTGIILKLDGGIYLGNETNSPELIANKVLKVSELENDKEYLNKTIAPGTIYLKGCLGITFMYQ